MSTTQYDVVIVGAGVAGCVSAFELAPDHDVLVVDAGQVAGETTGRSSGLITVTTDVLVPHMDAFDVGGIASHVNEYVRAFDGTAGFEFVERPGVELVPPGQEAAAREFTAELQTAGLDVNYLEPDELESRYPGVFVTEPFGGFVVYEEVGWVDPYNYATSLQRAAEAEGATFLTNVPVEAVSVEGGAVTGVETPEGRFEADHVVAAAGWRTRGLLEGLVEVPVRPFRLQIVTLDPGRPLDDDYPMAWDARTDLYWRPDASGHLHIGGGEYTVDDPEAISEDVDEWYVDLVAETMPECLEGFDQAQLVESWACVDGATPDAVGIVDAPADAPDGLVVATGFHGLGMMLSPVTGTTVRSLVTGEPTPFDRGPMALDRFDSRGVDFEFQAIGGGAMRE